MFEKFVSALGYKVLTIDYRGFADSSAVDVTETTMLEDALASVSWLRGQVGARDRLVVWGHSMGAAVAVRTVHELENSGDHALRDLVDTLVLEAPFNNLHDELKHAVFDSRSWLRRKFGLGVPINTILQSSDMQFR